MCLLICLGVASRVCSNHLFSKWVNQMNEILWCLALAVLSREKRGDRAFLSLLVNTVNLMRCAHFLIHHIRLTQSKLWLWWCIPFRTSICMLWICQAGEKSLKKHFSFCSDWMIVVWFAKYRRISVFSKMDNFYFPIYTLVCVPYLVSDSHHIDAFERKRQDTLSPFL